MNPPQVYMCSPSWNLLPPPSPYHPSGKCHLFLFFLCNEDESFLHQIMTCDEKGILYDSWWQPAQWLDWEEAPKHFPKPNLHQKKATVTVWWSAARLIYYRFLNPSKTITSEKFAQQIDAVHWKLQCLQPTLVNRKGPNSSPWQCLMISDCTLHNQCFKSWMNWAMEFCLIHHIHLTSHQQTTTSSSISTAFCRENSSTTSRRQKMLSKSSWNSEARIFMPQE